MILNYLNKTIFFFLFLSLSFSNQPIYGKVLDDETKEPLFNTFVEVIESNIVTKTDINGNFYLKLEETKINSITISFNMIGYQEKIISIKDFSDSKCDKCDGIKLNEIYLNQQSLELDISRIHSNYDNSSQISDVVITNQELDENFKTNIASTLSNYPNIGINSYGSVTSKPSVRGFSGDRFLLTKNGTETGDLSQSAIDHVIALDMTQVDKIDIIRGPKALIFGSNAIGGVVNTTLIGHPNIKVSKIHQRYFVGNESYNNGLYGNAMLYIPFLNNQFNIFLSDRKTKNEITPIGELNNTQSKTYNDKYGFTNYNKTGYINFSYEDFNMDYGIPPNSGGHFTGVDILLNKKTSEINYHTDIPSFSSYLDIKYSFIEYIHLELIDGDYNNKNIFELFNEDDYHLALAKKTNDFQIELNSNSNIYGIEYNKKDFSPFGYYLTPQTEESFLSFYAFRDDKFKNFDFLSSLRLGYLKINPKNTEEIQYINLDSSKVKKRNFMAASFSFGLRKKINEFEFNSWVMHTMRPPRVEELYSDGPHLGTYAYEIGNPELKVEKIYGIENSLNYKSQSIEIFNIPSSLDFSFITFYNYSPYYFEITKTGDCPEAEGWDPLSGTSHPCAGSDFIDWGSGEFGYLYKYNTRGSEAVIKGIETNLIYKLNNVKMSYNFSYVMGDNKTLNMPLSYINPMKQILNIEYNKNFYNMRFRFTKIHSQNRLGEFESYTSDAFVTDLVLSYNYKKINIIMQINNIFNETYYNHLSRIKNITPESGRNISISFKLHI